MGIDSHRFAETPDENFVCSICQDVMEDPVLLPCSHMFCRKCLVDWLQQKRQCPLDNKACAASQLIQAPPQFRSLLQSLKIKCNNSSAGCVHVCPMDELRAHLATCGFVREACKRGCGKQIFRHQQSHHASHECDNTEVHCATCKRSFRRPDVPGHKCVESLFGSVLELRNESQHLRETISKDVNTMVEKRIQEQVRDIIGNSMVGHPDGAEERIVRKLTPELKNMVQTEVAAQVESIMDRRLKEFRTALLADTTAAVAAEVQRLKRQVQANLEGEISQVMHSVSEMERGYDIRFEELRRANQSHGDRLNNLTNRLRSAGGGRQGRGGGSNRRNSYEQYQQQQYQQQQYADSDSSDDEYY